GQRTGFIARAPAFRNRGEPLGRVPHFLDRRLPLAVADGIAEPHQRPGRDARPKQARPRARERQSRDDEKKARCAPPQWGLSRITPALAILEFRQPSSAAAVRSAAAKLAPGARRSDALNALAPAAPQQAEAGERGAEEGERGRLRSRGCFDRVVTDDVESNQLRPEIGHYVRSSEGILHKRNSARRQRIALPIAEI